VAPQPEPSKIGGASGGTWLAAVGKVLRARGGRRRHASRPSPLSPREVATTPHRYTPDPALLDVAGEEDA
jgi:hypothetical protein